MGERNCGCGLPNNNDGVCIQTRKVYDSCRDKECIENVRVYLEEGGQEIIENAINVKCRKSELIWVYSDVEPVSFNRGYFTVDLKFFFRITLDVFCGLGNPVQVTGLATYDKKVVLFGSEGNAKVFQSKYRFDEVDCQMWQKNNLPIAQVEAVDPICLSARIVEPNDMCCKCDCDLDVNSLPRNISNVFNGNIVDDSNGRRIYVTLGLFTIVRLERDVQLLIPVYDFCIPECECVTSTETSPCEIFDKLKFPVDEFFPPERDSFEGLEYTGECGCGCGCGCND